MIVVYRFDFPEDVRRALADHYGEKGLATRKTITTWIDGLVSAALDDVMHDYDENQRREAEAKDEAEAERPTDPQPEGEHP